MCGRYALDTSPEELAKFFGLLPVPTGLLPSWNVAPTQAVLGIVQGPQGARVPVLFRWGLIPSWAKDPAIGNKLINARAETLAEKPTFRTALRRRRCLLPVSGYYEWSGEGKARVPHHIRLKSRQPFALAGLWDYWTSPDGSEIASCTIITTEANEMIRPFHHRMPIILRPDTWDTWLDVTTEDTRPIQPLLTQYPADEMESFVIGKGVNNARNNGPDLLDGPGVM